MIIQKYNRTPNFIQIGVDPKQVHHWNSQRGQTHGNSRDATHKGQRRIIPKKLQRPPKITFQQPKIRFSAIVKGRSSNQFMTDPKKPVWWLHRSKEDSILQQDFFNRSIVALASSSLSIIHLSQYFFTFPICSDSARIDLHWPKSTLAMSFILELLFRLGLQLTIFSKYLPSSPLAFRHGI